MLKKIRYRLMMVREVNKFAFGVRKYFAMICVISGLSMAVSLIIPMFYRMFVDQVIIGRDIGVIIFVVLGYMGFFIFTTILLYLRNYGNNRFLNRIIFRIKHRILANYLLFPFSEYEKRSTGDLKMCIDDDVIMFCNFVGQQTVDYIKSILTAIFAVGVIFLIEVRLATFSIIVIPLTFYIDHKISIKEKEWLELARKNNQNWNSWLHASLQGWREIKALNLQRNQQRIFTRYAHNYAEVFARWINCWVARVLVIPKIKDEFLMKFLLYFIGGLLIMREEISIGTLLIFTMYYDLLSESIRTISSNDAEMQSNMPFYDRVIKEINSHSKITKKKAIVEQVSKDISMKNVSYSYDKSMTPIVENLNLDIRQGERVAITGRSGSGKTTILRLLTGMLSPDSGKVLFCGTDLNQINHHFLYSKIGFVLQENLLFNISIGDNLKLACPKADDDLLVEACKKACIYDFIKAQPKGYETIIGERGIKLSGGQRQRLVLARLFLRDVDILIFDEATSSLDQYSENIIHDAINTIGREKTIIVVAHRESSIGLCERVISLN